MNIKKYLSLVTGVALSAIAITSCTQKDEWETPPINCENKFPTTNTTLAAFKSLAPTSGYLLIADDKIFDGYVVSSDESGNFYKTISIQDKAENPTAGISMEVDRSSNYADFPVGAHVRINARGLRLGLDRGTVKIGSVDPTYNIGRIPASLLSKYIAGVCNGNGLEVATIKPLELADINAAKNEQYINMLVKVPSAQFTTGDLFPTPKSFIDYVGGAGVDTDRTIEDASGNSVVIRNSGFFNEGSKKLPTGNGSATFVVSRYNSTWQMLIRNSADLNFAGTRVDSAPPKGGTTITYSGAFLENFESYSATNLEVYPKFVNDPLVGNRYWQLKTFSANKYIQLSANAGSGAYVTYFAVPIDFTAASQFKFDVNVGFFNGNVLKVYTTTNYTALGDISTATKTDITSSFTIPQAPAAAYGVLTPAGTYNIPAALTGNGFILFEYSGNASGASTTIQLDNIQAL
ncbi:DUF5689 domain-containing protein [Chryseobacterium caseinilyticum]|uniref:DUF5689 domain-containing protein n=1 Tax=Chryseobacterium caseinilyticum TaxID=2771428 RepID=A0ABR8ZI19_9FLAO|nr:DUF5689 domain-containing protein [Chryseobacterium caseinilyticum]MBD8084371.1 hypothetical protein [Chryseobacterium caseinilyticum]